MENKELLTAISDIMDQKIDCLEKRMDQKIDSLRNDLEKKIENNEKI